MRLGIVGLCLGLAACTPALQKASQSVFDALDAYYANAGITLPVAPPGLPEPATDTVLTKITLGSCQASWKPIPVLDAVAREDAQLFLYLGDHDYGLNDAGGDFAFKRRAKEIFLAFWREDPTSVRRTREGLYDDRIYGTGAARVETALF